jgi:amidophosphoribosyltransferase
MCGVFGVRSLERDVARLTYFGLFALQHRGQESAGIAVSEGGRLTAVREMGLVPQVFDEEKLAALPGEVAIGHTRYSTTGGARWANAQPLVFHGPAHGRSGTAGTSSSPGRSQRLLADGLRLATSSDTEVIAALLARDRSAPGSRGGDDAAPGRGVLGDALAEACSRSGIPSGSGRSRSAGSGTTGSSRRARAGPRRADVVRDVMPGEVVWIDADGCHTAQAVPRGRGAACIFEHVYFARPDSILDGTGVHAGRVRMGERLAAEAPVEADLVMPIPDSGTPAAIGFAKRSGIPFGPDQNRYVGRTFIEPDQELRRQGIRLKFNPLAEIAGRRIVIVDDSIVRGNTMRALVQMLTGAGAAEVHVRISSPPVVSPCFYGIDMADEDELAYHRSVEEMREHIGATSLHYLSLAGMQWATGLAEEDVCRACFTRDYPTRVPDDRLAAKHRFEAVGIARG